MTLHSIPTPRLVSLRSFSTHYGGALTGCSEANSLSSALSLVDLATMDESDAIWVASQSASFLGRQRENYDVNEV